jgi:hypothetical protein
VTYVVDKLGRRERDKTRLASSRRRYLSSLAGQPDAGQRGSEAALQTAIQTDRQLYRQLYRQPLSQADSKQASVQIEQIELLGVFRFFLDNNNNNNNNDDASSPLHLRFTSASAHRSIRTIPASTRPVPQPQPLPQSRRASDAARDGNR